MPSATNPPPLPAMFDYQVLVVDLREVNGGVLDLRVRFHHEPERAPSSPLVSELITNMVANSLPRSVFHPFGNGGPSASLRFESELGHECRLWRIAPQGIMVGVGTSAPGG